MKLGTRGAVLGLGLLAGMLGCKSREQREHERAVVSAKEKAAVTGKVQTLTYRDRDASVVTIVIEPPGPGEATERVTVTRAK